MQRILQQAKEAKEIPWPGEKEKKTLSWSGYLNSDQTFLWCLCILTRSLSFTFFPHCHYCCCNSVVFISFFLVLCHCQGVVAAFEFILCKSWRFCELVVAVDLSLHDCGGFSFYWKWHGVLREHPNFCILYPNAHAHIDGKHNHFVCFALMQSRCVFCCIFVTVCAALKYKSPTEANSESNKRFYGHDAKHQIKSK